MVTGSLALQNRPQALLSPAYLESTTGPPKAFCLLPWMQVPVTSIRRGQEAFHRPEADALTGQKPPMVFSREKKWHKALQGG